MREGETKEYYNGKLERKKLTQKVWDAKIIKILPNELTKLPTTLEEFQDFYFYWEPSTDSNSQKANMYYVDSSLTKLFKLAMWNARKIKSKSTKKYVTRREEERIYELFRGHRWISWKDSDNPKDYKLLEDAYEEGSGKSWALGNYLQPYKPES